MTIKTLALPLSSVVPDFWQRPTPLVLQAETSECGLACLAMIAGHFGDEPDMVKLRADHAIPSQGANLRQILTIAESLELSARAVKLDLPQLNELTLPCILHWDMNHFVVLTKVTAKRVTVLDPAIGKRTFTLHEFGNHFTGVAVELTPTSNFAPSSTKTKLRLRHFWQSAIGLKRHFALLFALSVLLQIFAITSPYYMQLVIDDVLLRRDETLLVVLTLGFVLLLLIEVFTQTFRQFLVLSLTSKLNLQMSTSVFQHLIRLPYSYFAKRHLGDVVSRFQSLGPVRDMITQSLVSAVLDGVMAMITLAVMFLYNVRLALITLAVIAVYLALKLMIFAPMHRISAERLAASANESTHFMESVRAIKTIKLLNHENARQNVWQHRLVAFLNTDIALSRWQISVQSINKLLFGLENLIIIYFAATAVMGNLLSVGMLFAFMSYKARFIGAIDNVITTIIDLKLLGVHFDRLSDVLFTEKETTVNAIPVSQDKEVEPASISVHNLSYRYSSHSPYIFKHVEFSIHAGECVAITGRSGCGKTTLLHCLMGLLPAQSGEININGTNVQQLPGYRQSIAAVMQEDQCLSGCLLDNIACFDPAPDIQRVTWAASMACLHDDIMAMPMQYQTLVGEMGSCLSGGQRQRLLIARALYKRPDILFMDEATASLDLETEKQVNQNLAQQQITRIIVAHRPQTIDMADRVFCMSNNTFTILPKPAKGDTP